VCKIALLPFVMSLEGKKMIEVLRTTEDVGGA
jgi:hypothetical protein